MVAGTVVALSRRHPFHNNLGISSLSMFHLQPESRFLIVVYRYINLFVLAASDVLLSF